MALARKEAGIAYALMLFSLIGVCGVQHFYMGKIFRGFIWLITFGLLGVGLFIDLFTIPAQVRKVNRR